MIVLGLHFGHDASVSVFRDGNEIAYFLAERNTRIKHSISLDEKIVAKALNSVNLEFKDVGFCAITSTQDMEIIHQKFKSFSISFKRHTNHLGFSKLPEHFRETNKNLDDLLIKKIIRRFLNKSDKLYPGYFHALSEYKELDIDEIRTTGWLDAHYMHPDWVKPNTLSNLSNHSLQDIVQDANVLGGFCYPVSVQLGQIEVAGYFINHHLAHASSTFYRSPFNHAAIHTHDGNNKPLTFNNGGFFIGQDSKVIPICPHHLNLGNLYEDVGLFLNLGPVGAAGKLMGLAPYGQASFFSEKFVGNHFDLESNDLSSISDIWINHCISEGLENGYDLSESSRENKHLSKFSIDVAASTQLLFEETLLRSIRSLYTLFENNKLNTQNLCLSGGTALNCPANSRIAKESSFKKIFIEPNCDDGGLSTGAAAYVYYNILRNHRFPMDKVNPYMGHHYSQPYILSSLKRYRYWQFYDDSEKLCALAAEELNQNKIIAWFEGNSEIGPRALGHRSILANPTIHSNHELVNRIKCREVWRPFAPAILNEFLTDWFDIPVDESPFMLFTAQVKSEIIPAVTHIDNSSRVQTVTSSSGNFYNLLKHFYRIAGVPLVLNTSFNGRNQPIVESPEEALEVFLNSDIDILYLNNYRVWKP